MKPARASPSATESAGERHPPQGVGARVLSRLRTWREPAGWDEFVSVVAAVGFVAASLLFAHLANAAPRGDYLPLEQEIMHSFRQADSGLPFGPPWLAAAIRDITALGSAIVLILLTLLIVGYLTLIRRYPAAVLLVIAIAGGQAMNATLKHLFARERPEATLHLVEVRSPSFPSGHSMAASIFYLSTGTLLTQTAKRRREKIYLLTAAFLLTVLIGFSRVYLGVHYPTDVVAGWCAGAAWALLCWAVARRMRRRGQLEPAPG